MKKKFKTFHHEVHDPLTGASGARRKKLLRFPFVPFVAFVDKGFFIIPSGLSGLG
jgi:hypothetical protein